MIEVSRLYRLDSGKPLRAFADVIFNAQVLVKGVRVVKNRDGDIFVSMPKQQGKDGKWYESVRLLDDDSKQALQDVVLEAFHV